MGGGAWKATGEVRRASGSPAGSGAEPRRGSFPFPGALLTLAALALVAPPSGARPALTPPPIPDLPAPDRPALDAVDWGAPAGLVARPACGAEGLPVLSAPGAPIPLEPGFNALRPPRRLPSAAALLAASAGFRALLAPIEGRKFWAGVARDDRGRLHGTDFAAEPGARLHLFSESRGLLEFSPGDDRGGLAPPPRFLPVACLPLERLPFESRFALSGGLMRLRPLPAGGGDRPAPARPRSLVIHGDLASGLFAALHAPAPPGAAAPRLGFEREGDAAPAFFLPSLPPCLLAPGESWRAVAMSRDAGGRHETLASPAVTVAPRPLPLYEPSMVYPQRGGFHHFTAAWPPPDPFDTAGVVLVDYPAPLGRRRNPTRVAEFALSIATRPEARDMFLRQLAWLRDAGPVFTFDFDWPANGERAPWVSAMPQGEAASAFAWGFRLTADPVWLDAAADAVRPLGAPPFSTPAGDGIWLEEYPGWDRDVLDGCLAAAAGLLDLDRTLPDGHPGKAETGRLLDLALAGIRHRASGFASPRTGHHYDSGRRGVGSVYYRANLSFLAGLAERDPPLWGVRRDFVRRLRRKGEPGPTAFDHSPR